MFVDSGSRCPGHGGESSSACDDRKAGQVRKVKSSINLFLELGNPEGEGSGLRFTVLLNSGGSNSPWSEFWSEFPHFMGMGVVPASSKHRNRKSSRFSVAKVPVASQTAVGTLASLEKSQKESPSLAIVHRIQKSQRFGGEVTRFLTEPLLETLP